MSTRSFGLGASRPSVNPPVSIDLAATPMNHALAAAS